MKLPATVRGLVTAAGLSFASAAAAAPIAPSLATAQAGAPAATTVQYTYRTPRQRENGWRAYGYSGNGYGRNFGAYGEGCVSGDDSTTSAYPSWMVCHRR
jgi:hypothetical protein